MTLTRQVIYACALSALASGTSFGASVGVRIENLNATGGFSFTPFWLGFHDGTFDTYDNGTDAATFPGITEIAEGGNTAPMSTRFGTDNPAGVDTTFASNAGIGGAPVFSPGESAAMTFDVGDPTVNRYFSYASMVVPSNDLFIANGNPTAHQLFDAGGAFLGPITILIYGSDVNDNASEVNNAFGGAAFSANGGAGVAEGGLIRDFFTNEPTDSNYLAGFIGTNDGTGTQITNAFASGDLIARITITPTPGVAGVMAIGGLAAIRRRRA